MSAVADVFAASTTGSAAALRIQEPRENQVIRHALGYIPVQMQCALAGEATLFLRDAKTGEELQRCPRTLVAGSNELRLRPNSVVDGLRNSRLALTVEIAGKVVARRIFGRGLVFLTLGQSNSTNSHKALLPRSPTSLLSAQDAQGQHVVLQTGDEGDVVPMAWDGWMQGERRSSVWPYVGDELVAESGLPIEFVNIGWSGSCIEQWSRFGVDEPDDPGHTALRQRFALIDPDVRKRGFDAVLFHQGESDAIYETSQPDYERYARNLIEYSRSYLADPEVPWFFSITSRNPGWPTPEDAFNPDGTAKHWPEVAAAQRNIIEDPTLRNVYAGPNTDPILHQAHFDTPQQLSAYRDLWVESLRRFVRATSDGKSFHDDGGCGQASPRSAHKP